MKTCLKYFSTLLCVFLLVSPHSPAQNNQKLLKELSDKSDVILEGKVVKQNSSWNQNKTRIFTEVTVQVDEYLKGSKGNKTLVVTTPGGEVGDVGELYTHMPKFSNDEQVLLFVKEDKKDKSLKVANGEEGKITLYDDKITGEKVTSSNQKISTLKKQIKDYVNKKPQQD
jgi:hypothetical protein